MGLLARRRQPPSFLYIDVYSLSAAMLAASLARRAGPMLKPRGDIDAEAPAFTSLLFIAGNVTTFERLLFSRHSYCRAASLATPYYFDARIIAPAAISSCLTLPSRPQVNIYE